MRSPFSAPIVLPLHWLVCLKGFVMPADRIQTFLTWEGCSRWSVTILPSSTDLATTTVYFHLTAIRLSAYWIFKFMNSCAKYNK